MVEDLKNGQSEVHTLDQKKGAFRVGKENIFPPSENYFLLDTWRFQHMQPATKNKIKNGF